MTSVSQILPGAIGGLAKNRLRAMSNVSVVDQITQEEREAEAMAQEETAKKKTAEVKTWKNEIISALLPWDPEEFDEGNSIYK